MFHLLICPSRVLRKTPFILRGFHRRLVRDCTRFSVVHNLLVTFSYADRDSGCFFLSTTILRHQFGQLPLSTVYKAFQLASHFVARKSSLLSQSITLITTWRLDRTDKNMEKNQKSIVAAQRGSTGESRFNAIGVPNSREKFRITIYDFLTLKTKICSTPTHIRDATTRANALYYRVNMLLRGEKANKVITNDGS